MFELIRNGLVVADEWKTLALAEDDTPQSVKLPVGPVLVSLPVWRTRRAELIRREYEHGWPLGIRLAAGESLEGIGRDIDDFTVIAVEFERGDDGNGYAIARLLRERYGYKGELRAVGDVPRGKLARQYQVDFDTFAVRVNRKAATVLSGLFGFNAANRPEAGLPLGAVAG